MFKKYIHLFIWFVASIYSFTTYAAETQKGHQNAMLPTTWDWAEDWVIDNKLSWTNWEDQLFSIFVWIRNSMEILLPIVAVGVFLLVGIRIAIAKWNPEEFKKAWMQMIYAVVGIFVVWFAWAAVKLVAGLNI